MVRTRSNTSMSGHRPSLVPFTRISRLIGTLVGMLGQIGERMNEADAVGFASPMADDAAAAERMPALRNEESVSRRSR